MPDYTTATATPDLSHVYQLHHSSHQCRIFNPLSEARDLTRILGIRVGFVNWGAMMGTPRSLHVVNTEPAHEDKGVGPVDPGGCQMTASFSEQESEAQRGR